LDDFFAKLLGLDGIEIEGPELIGEALDMALHAQRPFVIDAPCDPNVPALPPHINIKQAKGLMFSLLGGDVNTKEIIVESAKEMMETAYAKLKR
jgi:pyruvate dehydrogenase (quinone)